MYCAFNSHFTDILYNCVNIIVLFYLNTFRHKTNVVSTRLLCRCVGDEWLVIV